jgi:DNA adenine methylase
MEPIIKWPGGKSSEFDLISPFFPAQYNRYIEPFFGGGAVYFRLSPKKSVINDICCDLVNIYRFLGSATDRKKFAKYLLDYASNWDKISKYIKIFENDIRKHYNSYKQEGIANLKKSGGILIESKIDDFNGLFSEEFCLSRSNLQKQIVNNITSKLKRTAVLEDRHGKLSDEDLEKNIETAFRSGFYMHFRDVLNYPEKFVSDDYKKTANFYFIREFCYGSMFRFNKDGKFNIPYGGIAYNTKNFSSKIEYATSEKVYNLLKNTQIFNDDFLNVLSKIKLNNDDFIFLDPPYDTDFKDYNGTAFGKKDQQRLAEFLYTTKAQFVLVIKNTPFISKLYTNKPGIFIESFDKLYQYNVKGRNNRDVEHLIIRNFQ